MGRFGLFVYAAQCNEFVVCLVFVFSQSRIIIWARVWAEKVTGLRSYGKHYAH